MGHAAGTGALALALLAGTGLPAQAAPTPSNSPTAPPGAFQETNLAADRTANNFFYRIPALSYLGNGVVLAAWDGRPGSSRPMPPTPTPSSSAAAPTAAGPGGRCR